METGGGRGRARHKDEVISPEEHLDAADDRATPLDGAWSVTSLVCHKPIEQDAILHEGQLGMILASRAFQTVQAHSNVFTISNYYITYENLVFKIPCIYIYV